MQTVTFFKYYFKGPFTIRCLRWSEDDGGGAWGEEDMAKLCRGLHKKRAGGYPSLLYM